MKFRSFISICLIACAALMATLLPTTASAKQCVWNKGGYVMSVSWFRPIDIGALESAHGGLYKILRNIAPPVITQHLVAGTGSCNETNEELVAFISVAGALGFREKPDDQKAWAYPTGRTHLHPNVKTSNLTQRPGNVQPVGCQVGTDGWCRVDELAMTPRLPDRPFMVVMPSTTHYLDFWGTIFDVTWGPGGAIR